MFFVFWKTTHGGARRLTNAETRFRGIAPKNARRFCLGCKRNKKERRVQAAKSTGSVRKLQSKQSVNASVCSPCSVLRCGTCFSHSGHGGSLSVWAAWRCPNAKISIGTNTESNNHAAIRRLKSKLSTPFISVHVSNLGTKIVTSDNWTIYY